MSLKRDVLIKGIREFADPEYEEFRRFPLSLNEAAYMWSKAVWGYLKDLALLVISIPGLYSIQGPLINTFSSFIMSTSIEKGNGFYQISMGFQAICAQIVSVITAQGYPNSVPPLWIGSEFDGLSDIDSAEQAIKKFVNIVHAQFLTGITPDPKSGTLIPWR
jgi:hypothetical protein